MELGLSILYFVGFSCIYCMLLLLGAIILTSVEEALLDALSRQAWQAWSSGNGKEFHLQICCSAKQRSPSPESLKSS